MTIMLMLIFAAPLPVSRKAHRTDEVIVPQGFTAMAEWYQKNAERFARREGKPER